MIKPQQAAPMGRKYRIGSDSVWPLRNADGLTFAEAKRLMDQTPGNRAALKSELRF